MCAVSLDPERRRLAEVREQQVPWRKWGPYLSERQWGTVREDYSTDGNAWDYFSHDQARSRAYRWGEDGLAGFCDDKQLLCFCLGLWNGKDPILKERLFGLTNSEGNHGEDVKECYFYLDSTPTHSYAKYLYKYPQAPYPYDEIVATNKQRSRKEPEYELIDTGVFDEDRYFDVFVEYAKPTPEELLIQVTVCNRGPEAAELHVLPQWWFRNTWWRDGREEVRPVLRAVSKERGLSAVAAEHPQLGRYQIQFDRDVPLLFTENETNQQRIFGTPNPSPYVKDAFDDYLVRGRTAAVNPSGSGTKLGAHYRLDVPAKGQLSLQLRLTQTGRPRVEAAVGPTPGVPFSTSAFSVDTPPATSSAPASAPVVTELQFGEDFERAVAARRREADEFYQRIFQPTASEDERNVVRQALSGMLWSKQYYHFDLDLWLSEHGHSPLRGKRKANLRNAGWFHMVNDDIISMPDKWEYPWYAAWDLAFHAIALDAVDPDFAKHQLSLMLNETYLHPSGQLPAYEWNFGDVNPPVHGFAALFTYHAEKQATGRGDLGFLRETFHKLLLNFSWWANRKDPKGRNVFEGGFLGLDNIGVFDRSSPLPTGGFMEQADGTAWMAMYCQQMFEMALELGQEDHSYEGLATKFLEHFYWIAGAMDRLGENQDELWDEEDGFFYDVLHLPNGEALRLKVRSMVGLLPLCATATVSAEAAEKFPGVGKRIGQFLRRYPDLVANIHPLNTPGHGGRRLLAVCNESKLRSMLTRMLDESRFLSPHGIRSLSRWHLEHPFEFDVKGQTYVVQYQPGESESSMFGGNSNWRGPVWFPINLMIVRALGQFYMYYGDTFKIECPTGSGKLMNLFEVSQEISRRLVSTFLRGADGRRPVYGNVEKFQTDPHWREQISFYEYFHGDTGAGLGASHQTGWTGIVARLAGLTHVDPVVALQVGSLQATSLAPATRDNSRR
ncbi:MAG TPA: glucosidase [Polyangiaceae bacterium]|nr:glucosidase [Polyangiaceae bacterium]